jgi:VWFA-related protein
MPRRSAALPAVLCSLALAAALPALAQGAGAAPSGSPPSGEVFSESIDVDVVNVQVFVTDASGRPVNGLAKGDFELRVDGRPVPITNFYAGAEPSPGAPTALGEAPAVPEGQRLTLVIFVDNINLSAAGRYRALQALEPFLRAVHPADRVLLASYEGTQIVVRQLPPGDVGAVVAAFKTVASKRAWGVHAPAEAELSARDLGLNGGKDGGLDMATPGPDVLDDDRGIHAGQLLRALQDFIGSVGGLPGRKAVLYVAENLALPGWDPLLQDLVQRANAQQVTLYGLGALESKHALGSDLDDTLYRLAAPTGGLGGASLFSHAALLDRIRDDLGSYYSLGFAPEAPQGGGSHRLEVRVPGRAGVTVRFPTSYAARGREERLADRAVAALDLGLADNPLGVRLAVEREQPAAGGRRAVSLLVELPMASLTLVPGQGVREGRMALAAVVRDGQGNRLPPQRAAVPVRVPEARLGAALKKTAGYRMVLELPPGAARVAVALSDELGGRESVVLGGFEVGRRAARPVAARTPRRPAGAVGPPPPALDPAHPGA